MTARKKSRPKKASTTRELQRRIDQLERDRLVSEMAMNEERRRLVGIANDARNFAAVLALGMTEFERTSVNILLDHIKGHPFPSTRFDPSGKIKWQELLAPGVASSGR